jgi:hypothetical protein
MMFLVVEHNTGEQLRKSGNQVNRLFGNPLELNKPETHVKLYGWVSIINETKFPLQNPGYSVASQESTG